MGDESNKRLPHYLERRNHARRSVIESRLISVELGDAARGVLIDVGEGGMAVQPFVPLPVGAESDLYFETPHGIRVKARGMVAWVGENGRTGIRFTDVEPEGLVEIRRWTEDDELGAADPSSAYSADFTLLPSFAPVDVEILVAERQPAIAVATDTPEQLADRARTLTNADGAAIALREEGVIRCVATVGEAPDVGATVSPGESLAALCVETAQPVLCCDARSDRRVNREAALALNMVSCAMVPIVAGGDTTGLVCVFSGKPDAFDEKHLASLTQLAAALRQRQ
jgi:hypothetical protein